MKINDSCTTITKEGYLTRIRRIPKWRIYFIFDQAMHLLFILHTQTTQFGALHSTFSNYLDAKNILVMERKLY